MEMKKIIRAAQASGSRRIVRESAVPFGNSFQGDSFSAQSGSDAIAEPVARSDEMGVDVANDEVIAQLHEQITALRNALHGAEAALTESTDELARFHSLGETQGYRDGYERGIKDAAIWQEDNQQKLRGLMDVWLERLAGMAPR